MTPRHARRPTQRSILQGHGHRRGRRTPLGLLIVLLMLTGCAALPVSVGGPDPACMPHFAYAGGWLGGDSVYSIPVHGGESRHETIWVFGDTWVGDDDATDRDGATIVRNSVAVSQCDSRDGFEIAYDWRLDTQGQPTAIFKTDRDRHYVWPFDGFFLDDTLYVVLLEVRDDTPRGPLGLPIRVTRSLLARVENPDDPPRYWRVETRPLTEDGAPMLSPGLFVERGFVHLMATPNVDSGMQPRFIARLSVDTIEEWPDDLTRRLETFTNRGAWEPGLRVRNARMLMADNATEMTIDRLGPTGRYFAVYSAPVQTANDGGPSSTPELDANSIFARTAISLTGPWSKRQRVHVIAEGLARDPGESQGELMCYAGKAHAEHSPPGVLALTYVCNLAPDESGDVWAVLKSMQTRMDVYRPKVAVHPWPETEAFAPGSGAARR